MNKHIFKIILFWLIASISFVLIGGFLVISANGYKINWSGLTLQKTGLISLRSQPNNVQVMINGKLKSQKTPYVLDQLLPGWYDIEVTKAQYQTWSRTIQVSGGFASNYNNIILFLTDPIIKEGTQDDASTLSNLQTPTDLGFSDYDIFRNVNGSSVDIARLSQKILAAYWYSDHSHVVYQVGNEINICEFDGQDAHLLIKLDSSDPAKIDFKDGGKTMLVGQDDKVYEVKIR